MKQLIENNTGSFVLTILAGVFMPLIVLSILFTGAEFASTLWIVAVTGPLAFITWHHEATHPEPRKVTVNR